MPLAEISKLLKGPIIREYDRAVEHEAGYIRVDKEAVCEDRWT